MNSQLQFEINELRQTNMQYLLGSIGVMITALVVASILPTLLMQFIYTDQAALMAGEPPFLLQNGSMIVFVLGVLYFLYVALMTMMRSRKIVVLKQQLAMVGSTANFSNAELEAQQKELASLEKMVDDALAEDKKSKKSSAKSKKSSAKK